MIPDAPDGAATGAIDVSSLAVRSRNTPNGRIHLLSQNQIGGNSKCVFVRSELVMSA